MSRSTWSANYSRKIQFAQPRERRRVIGHSRDKRSVAVSWLSSSLFIRDHSSRGARMTTLRQTQPRTSRRHNHSMNESRRQSNFAINAQLVRTLLNSQFPALDIESIEFLGEGWDSAAYLVRSPGADSASVFRFPKRRERQVWVESEIAH